MKSSQIKQVFYHPTKKYYVTDRSLWPGEPDRSHFPDLSAGGRRRRERGARVTGLRSEAGRECHTSPGLVGRYCAAVLSTDEGLQRDVNGELV